MIALNQTIIIINFVVVVVVAVVFVVVLALVSHADDFGANTKPEAISISQMENKSMNGISLPYFD